MTMSLKAVLFDLDGTLIEVKDRMYQSCHQAMQRMGLPPVMEDQYWAAYSSYKLGQLVEDQLRAQFFHLLLEEHERFDGQVHPIAGAVEALAFCRRTGLATGVVTSRQSHPERVAAELMAVDLAHFIDVIQTQQGIPVLDSLAKEHRLLESISTLGLVGSQCAYVGDLPDDVLSGKRAGLALTIAVRSGGIRTELLEAVQPDVILDHVGELPEFLERGVCG